MKGNGWMVGAVMALISFAAPAQAAVSAGNIFAGPAMIGDTNRQELRVQMAATDARVGTAKPAVEAAAPIQPSQAVAGETKPADGQAVAGDQLNDSGRSLRGAPPAQPSPQVAVAANDPPAQRTVAMARNDHSVWDETSTLGKAFIAFGTLLTIASAARMFMA